MQEKLHHLRIYTNLDVPANLHLKFHTAALGYSSSYMKKTLTIRTLRARVFLFDTDSI